MRRRELILGAAAAVPLVGAPQPRAAMRVVGFLHGASPDSQSSHVVAFRDGLGQSGFVEGGNVTIEYRWAEGHFDKFPELAADLVRRRVDVIAVPGHSGAALAAKAATASIPIVFGVPDDPVTLGLVASFAHPGGNATDVSYFNVEVVAKRVELLRELMPTASRVAVLVNPTNITSLESAARAAKAAKAIGLQVQIINAGTSSEIEAAFVALGRTRPDALLVAPDVFFNNQREQLVVLAARQTIPASYPARDYVEAGGLMSYGASLAEMFRQVGAYTGGILNGQKPADLPVVQPTRLELLINLKTAKSLGITIPQSILLRADEIIQ
jgi:putative tryptophan/tyrosine transport system substrate-binding protein